MSEIVRNPTVVATTVELGQEDGIELGQWYWVKGKDEEWLGCVTHVGSNYVKMTGVEDSSTRIHLDKFAAKCRREPHAPQVIERHVLEQKQEVRRLMAEVVALTARLGIGQTAALSAGSEGQALARLDPEQDVKRYKTDLVRAKEEDLPTLFKEIEGANAALAMWMKAETLPLKAQFGQMKGVISRIDDRIFNVELYAGLTEQVKQIADGEPATMTEKVRLMQRRHYMDEECLAQYEVGGMEFKDIGEFDAWLAKPVNRDRILPFLRCIVAFRVRRHDKLREIHSFIDFFDAVNKMQADKLTFLYIRNGDLIYRMDTQLEFGERLFPDTDHHILTAGTKLWAKVFGGHVDHIITDAQYQGLHEEYRATEAKFAEEKAGHPTKRKAWRERKLAAKEASQPFNEAEPHLWAPHNPNPKDQHAPYEPNNIYYDDIQKKIAEEIQQSNRIAIIIQGLLDRSIVLHPHPPWKIWAEGGADQALELIYDSSRALVGGDPPDFEAYRKRLNASLKVGSVTVGQRSAWYTPENEDGRRKKPHYRDPGPNAVARIVEFQRIKGRCGYAWYREGEGRETFNKQIRVRFVCDADQVLNVDAYTPGDFRLFFSDSRTRANYLQWAPLLLEAEEYHAGNREVEAPPPPAQRTPSWEGQRAYRRRKERKELIGKAVRLTRDVTMRNGVKYKAGSLWRVLGMERGTLTIGQITKTGNEPKDSGRIRGLEPRELEVDYEIPTPNEDK
jgi:hypothetical protein